MNGKGMIGREESPGKHKNPNWTTFAGFLLLLWQFLLTFVLPRNRGHTKGQGNFIRRIGKGEHLYSSSTPISLISSFMSFQVLVFAAGFRKR